jgi:hypothetical protein
MPIPRYLRPIAAAKLLRRNVRTVIRLVGMERKYYAGALHPSMWRRGFFSNRVYTYPRIMDPSAVFISDARYHFRSRDLNTPSARLLLEHKNVFADVLTARGLGSCAPEVYGTVTADGLLIRSPDALERLRKQATVVLKPSTGQGGTGVRLVSPTEVEDMAAEGAVELLVQEQVVPHPDLARIYPGSLNTVRVLAVRLSGHGPVLAAAVHRWGAAGTGPVDNISSGGLCSRVDLETGRLGPAVGRARARQRAAFDEHPDTGARITGELVPEWDAVRGLALELMNAFPELTHVGWDLAVSDSGVQIIEGNGNMPAVSVFQFHGSFLEDPRLIEYYTSRGLLPSP